MRLISSIIFLFLTLISYTGQAKAVTASCPNGGTLVGFTCFVGPTYSCPSGYVLNGNTCTQTIPGKNCDVSFTKTVTFLAWSGSVDNGRQVVKRGVISGNCLSPTSSTIVISGLVSGTINYGVYSGLSSLHLSPAYYIPNNTISYTPHIGTSQSFTFTGSGYVPTKYVTIPATPSCSVGTFNVGTVLGDSCTYAATISFNCNPGDTLFEQSPGVWKCQPPTVYAPSTKHYYCNDADGLGVTDTFATGSNSTPGTCRPHLLTYNGERKWHCPVVTGDPSAIVGGSASWTIDGGLSPATGYTVTGPYGTPLASSMKWVGGTTCSYTPPRVDAVYSYTSRHCANATHTLSADQMWCVPPVTQSNPTLSYILSCVTGGDVLNGNSCTPPLYTYPAATTTTYSCPTTMPNGTVLNPDTNMCMPPQLTAPVTTTSQLVCGTNAKLNPVTMKCDYVSIPAINVSGAYSCPALYTVGTGANQGWCIPTPNWAYPAAWDYKNYTCPDGGTLGLNSNGQPNGLCYLP